MRRLKDGEAMGKDEIWCGNMGEGKWRSERGKCVGKYGEEKGGRSNGKKE